MTNMLVLAPAYTTEDSTWRCLRESAELNGVELCMYGLGWGFPHLEAYRTAIELAQRFTGDYVLHTDAYDVLINRWNELEVANLIENSPDGLIISCNDECWPAGPWSDAYRKGTTPWWSACGAQYTGRKEQMIWLWEEFLNGKWSAECGGGNQEMLHRMQTAGRDLSLDTECRIFQIMGHQSRPHIAIKDGKAYNKLTGTFPMFLHYGGRAPGIEEMFERLYGGQRA